MFRELFSKQCILGTVGVCLAAFGAFFAVFWMDFFDSQLAQEMKLAPNSRSYDMWKSPPIPISMDIYLYNWTNPTNFIPSESENFTDYKPILVQMGPYRFTEIKEKVDIDWHPTNDTVSFRQKSTFFFDAAGSNGTLDDIITTLNIIALAAASKAKYWSYINQKTVSLGLNMYGQEVFIVKSVRELLFEGYQDDMIDMARAMPSLNEHEISVPFDRFGWFYMRNATSNLTGHYNMHTGENDISQIGRIREWNYRSRTDFFSGPCGQINGSAGEFYPPKQNKSQGIAFFSPDMCRSMSFDYADEETINGIVGYKYSAGKRMVNNGTEYPENKCFHDGESVPSGVMNVTACRFGTPVFMSFPHFYAADPFYLKQVDGLRPNKSLHEFYMTLEPNTGIPLDVAARLQINMLVTPYENIALYQNVPRMFFPVLWFEQHVTMNEEMAAEVRTVLMVPKIGYICCGIIVAIGIALAVWLPIVRFVVRRRRETKIASEMGMMKGKINGLGSNDKMLTPEGSPLIKNGVHTTIVRSSDERNGNYTAAAVRKEAEATGGGSGGNETNCDNNS